MPKRVQDIVPTNHRTIRDISIDEINTKPLTKSEKKALSKIEQESIVSVSSVSIDSVRKSTRPRKVGSGIKASAKAKVQEEVIEEKIVQDRTEHVEITRMHVTPPPPPKPKVKKWPWILGGVVVLVAVIWLAIAGSNRFARANFNISLKTVPVNINSSTLVIPPAGTSSSSFGYKVISVSGTASSTVPATAGPLVETKAQGSVTIYNSFGMTSQRLVAGTRIASDNGLVYRIKSTVSVPGYKKTATGIIPGTVKATIIADQSGANYNISGANSISDFKFLGYKGLPTKYDGFYARLASDVSGGFSGTRLVVAPEVLNSSSISMQGQLKTKLIEQLKLIVPTGYVLYPTAVAESFGDLNNTSTSGTTAKLTMTGNLYGIILKKIDLANILAGATSTSVFGGSSFDVPGIDSLQITIANLKDFSNIAKAPIVAKFSGTFKLVGAVQIDSLKKALAGKSLDATAAVLKKYSSVLNLTQSSGEVIPPWVSIVPTDVNRINITIK